MKLFTFAAYVLALSATFWLIEVSVDTFKDKCEPDQPTLPERVKVTILGYLGYPPPEAPWWRPLCQLTSPDMAENVNMLHNYMIFCVVIVFCFWSLEIRKPVRGKYSRARKVLNNGGKQDQQVKQSAGVGMKSSTGARQDPRMANNSLVLARTKLKNTAPALLYPFWSIKDIVLKDPVIPNTVKQICSTESVFRKQTGRDRPLQILLDNMKKHFLQNRNNNNVSNTMVENNIEEIFRSSESPKQEGRFDKAILGPVTKSLQALSQVVVVMFQSFGIPENVIRWSTVKTQYGPSKITAQSATMMADTEVDGGIDLTVNRVTGVQGLIRNVSSQSYRLAYRGLVLYGESTACMCGPGWHL